MPPPCPQWYLFPDPTPPPGTRTCTKYASPGRALPSLRTQKPTARAFLPHQDEPPPRYSRTRHSQKLYRPGPAFVSSAPSPLPTPSPPPASPGTEGPTKVLKALNGKQKYKQTKTKQTKNLAQVLKFPVPQKESKIIEPAS